VETELVQFQVAGGGVVLVEVDDQEPGVARASRVDDMVVQAKQSPEPALDSIRAMANVALERLRDLAQRPDELEAEVGVRLNAEVGAVIAQTPGRGHLKVKLAWKAISG
jgi:Trypsin-co-occurring domain 1